MAALLLEILRSVPDHRRCEGQRFELATVLLYAILAMVAGANCYRQLHEFIRIHRQRLNKGFKLNLRYGPGRSEVCAVFLNVSPQRSRKVNKVERDALTPCSAANCSSNSLIVMSGVASMFEQKIAMRVKFAVRRLTSFAVGHGFDVGPCAAIGESFAHGVAVIRAIGQQDLPVLQFSEHVLGAPPLREPGLR